MKKELNISKCCALTRIVVLVSGLLFLSSEVFAFIHSSDSRAENLVQYIYDERNQKRAHTQHKPGSVAEITDHNYDLLDRLEQKTQRGHVVRSHLKNACAWHLDRRQCSESSCVTYTLRFLRAGGSQSACTRLIFETASSYTYDNNGNRLTVTSPGG